MGTLTIGDETIDYPSALDAKIDELVDLWVKQAALNAKIQAIEGDVQRAYKACASILAPHPADEVVEAVATLVKKKVEKRLLSMTKAYREKHGG